MATARKVLEFRPAARRRIHEDIAEQLRDAILDGRFAAGSKLPPERELAAEFEVNRTSIREAIKQLESQRLVRVRQGDGATVQPTVDASLDILPFMVFHGGRIDVRVMEELREVLRPLLYEMARLALERCGESDVAKLRSLRDILADTAIEREDRFVAAREVLIVLSDITGNRVWQMLARRARDLLASEPLREARRRLKRDPSPLASLIDDCVDHHIAGRPDEALAALRRAIDFVGDRIARAEA